MLNRKIIAVVGASTASVKGLEQAEAVGRLLAQRGAVLICGGLGGIMDAASCGAQQAGGEVIGILPGNSSMAANPYITLPIVTAMGHARNAIIAQTAQALIAIEGGYGTLSEIAIGMKLGKPVVQLGSWPQIDTGHQANTPEQAVQMIFNLLEGGSFHVE